MDKVFIEGLRIPAVIGIYAWERRAPQPVVVDLEMEVDLAAAVRSDDIQDTISYETVSQRLAAHFASREWNLLEVLAESSASLIHETFGVRRLRLRLAKPEAIRAARAVGVVIERDYSEAA